MAKEYYIRVQGKVQGPLSIERIQLLIKRRQFHKIHEISADGKKWRSAGSVPGLFRAPPELIIRQKPVAQPQPAASGDSATPSGNSSDEALTDIVPDAGSASSVGEVSLADGWFYLVENTNVGPITRGEIQELLKCGALSAFTLVWHTTLADWAPAFEVAELAGVLPASQSDTADAPQSVWLTETGAADSGSAPQSGAAMASLIFGILGIVLLPIIGSVVSVILGHVAIGDIRRGTAKSETSSTATTGLLLGYAGMALWAIFILAYVLIRQLRH